MGMGVTRALDNRVYMLPLHDDTAQPRPALTRKHVIQRWGVMSLAEERDTT